MNCEEKYEKITKLLIKAGKSITTMESCTSGRIASLITDTEGSSAIMKGAYVTYSNEAKIRCGVPASIIDTYGVYSAETAAAMARACLEAYGADISLGVTGSFSNVDPANPDSVPGEVYFAICRRAADINGTNDEYLIQNFFIKGVKGENRAQAKMYVADKAADELLAILDKQPSMQECK